MPLGEFIKDRWFVRAIRRICQAQDITMTSFSDHWLLELSKGNARHRIIGYKFDLNSGIASECASDKVASYTLLSAAHIPAVPHALARTKVIAYDDWKRNDWQQVVIKPLIGTSGMDVQKFATMSDAADWIDQQSKDAWAISPFMQIQREIRLIILDDAVLLSYEKQAVTVNGLAMFNLGLGATPHVIETTSEISRLALDACKALGLRLAAVDIIQCDDGTMLVLEVNDGIMMEHFARTSPAYQALSYKVYESIISAVMNSRN